jgi:thiosulfate dehydrogenase
MKHGLIVAVAAVVLALYAGAIFVGLRMPSSTLASAATLGLFPDHSVQASAWHSAPMSSVPADQQASVELGRLLFTETPTYLSRYTPSRIACSSCHEGAGTAPFASPVVGSSQAYPQRSKRAGRVISLEDRVQECMTRSENGSPLPSGGQEMQAMLAYIRWLSEPHPRERAFVGRGLEKLAALTPDPSHGAGVYAAQCAGCHGEHGEGARRPFPPLWGPESFNDGAGMNTLPKLSAFIHHNMPQNRKGVLSVQDSYDVAAYVMQQPRPAFNHANDRF